MKARNGSFKKYCASILLSSCNRSLLHKPHVTLSVTRFGEISPFWQNLQSLGQFFKALFTIWQNFETTLANFVYFWANCH